MINLDAKRMTTIAQRHTVRTPFTTAPLGFLRNARSSCHFDGICIRTMSSGARAVIFPRVRLSVWSNLRSLVLGLVLGLSYSGEVIAHGLAHQRELDRHSQHHAQHTPDGLNRGESPELEVPDAWHTDPTVDFGERARNRAALLPAFVSWEPAVIVSTVNAVVPWSSIDVKINPRRGPPPRLRAPPAI